MSGSSERSGASLPALGLLLTTVVTLSACATLVPQRVEHAAFLGASTADVVTTSAALDRGARELNPLLGDNPSTARLVTVKAAGWAVFVNLEAVWEQSLGRGLRWWERALFWLIPTAAATWAAHHNAGVCRPECIR